MGKDSKLNDNNYTWLTVKEIAKLLCKDISTIQKLCQKNQYVTKTITGKGRGGKVLMIALESMTQETQMSFFQNRELEENEFINSLNEKEREKVAYKYRIVMAYLEFKSKAHSGGRMNEFLEQMNKENPAAGITRAQIYQWEKKFFEQGIQGLYDSRGTHTKGTTTIPEPVWETFYALWFHNPRATVQQCYEMSCEKHRKEFPAIPSVYAFRRKLEKLPEPVRILRNKGKKAFEDNCLPHMEIDYEALSSNEQWVADHHVFDVLVEDEKGNIFRPWLSAWLDRRSRYIVGYEINACSPNSDIVLSSFAKACTKSGIPETVLLDNGKDFKVYDLFNNDNAMSIARQMGIKVINAIVKNAKAKPIERYFRTLEEKYFATLPCYIAGKPHLRPEKMSMTNKKLKLIGLCMSYAEFLSTAELIIKEANNTKHRGNGMQGRTPYQAYMESFSKPVHTVKNEDVLNLLFQRTSRPLKVGRNGVKVSATGYCYNNTRLFEWIGKDVFVRYNSDDVSKVYVYSQEDRFICTAQCNELAQLGTEASIQLLKEYNHYRKERRERLKGLLPSVPDYTLQDYLNDRKENHKEYDVRQDETAVPVATGRYRHLEVINGEEQVELPKESSTIPYDKQKRKRQVDEALYEFIKKAGGQQ